MPTIEAARAGKPAKGSRIVAEAVKSLFRSDAATPRDENLEAVRRSRDRGRSVAWIRVVIKVIRTMRRCGGVRCSSGGGAICTAGARDGPERVSVAERRYFHVLRKTSPVDP